MAVPSDEAPGAPPATPPPPDLLERLVSLGKQRGFFFPSSEIYGGINALYDYGPLGTRLRRNIRNRWWRSMVELRDDIEGIESSVIMNPQVWVASGHVAGFSDPLVDCTGSCRRRWRADHLGAERVARGKPADAPGCPECGGPLTPPRQFNLMFRTFLGPVEDSSAQVYLRPETAQGMFVDFKSVLNEQPTADPLRHRPERQVVPQRDLSRQLDLPHPRVRADGDGVLLRAGHRRRSGSSTGAPSASAGTSRSWECAAHACACATTSRTSWPTTPRPPPTSSTSTPSGWGELEGIANRTDFDLSAHQKASGVDLSYLDPVTGNSFVPYVIEPAAGVDRIMLTILIDAYDEEMVRGETRTVLRMHPDIAPVQVAVLPLSKKDELTVPARALEHRLRPHFATDYDETQAIGRRYRRQDEIGTPLAVTFDFDSLQDDAVTIRERDGMTQVRVPIAGLEDAVRDQLVAFRRRTAERAGAGG